MERLSRLEALQDKSRAEFDQDPFLRDIAERNLEVAAQCVLDIAHRVISLAGAPKPHDYCGAILELGELGVLPADFAHSLAPLAGFRNILVYEYVGLDWDEVYRHLHRIGDLARFADHLRQWLARQLTVSKP